MTASCLPYNRTRRTETRVRDYSNMWEALVRCLVGRSSEGVRISGPVTQPANQRRFLAWINLQKSCEWMVWRRETSPVSCVAYVRCNSAMVRETRSAMAVRKCRDKYTFNHVESQSEKWEREEGKRKRFRTRQVSRRRKESDATTRLLEQQADWSLSLSRPLHRNN